MAGKAIFTPLPNGSQGDVPSKQTDYDSDKKDGIAEENRRKEIRFKASHTLLIGFFLWILYFVHWRFVRIWLTIVVVSMYSVYTFSPRASF